MYGMKTYKITLDIEILRGLHSVCIFIYNNNDNDDDDNVLIMIVR